MKYRGKMENVLLQEEPVTRSRCLIEKVGRKMGWEKEIIDDIINPQQIVILRIPAKSWGKVFVVWGCVVLHNNSRGPYKGGIRIASDVDIWETAELSRLMTMKTAVTEIEFGGGKTGIRLNMDEAYKYYGKKEKDKNFEKIIRLDICEQLAYQIKRFLEDYTYIPAPDMGSGPDEMAYIYNQTQDPATVTGKPEGIPGWLPGRKESTGYGCAYATKMFVENILNKNMKEISVAIQGFGNVGSHLAVFLNNMGVKIVGITDAYGGIYDKAGINIPELTEYSKKNGTVKGFTKNAISNEQLLALDVDILIPAACGNVINKQSALNVRAKGIVEAANSPVTEEGMEILNEKKIPVVPDIIANSGGVIASMEEYSRSLSAIKINKEEVFEIIKKKICDSLNSVFEMSKDGKMTYPEAAIKMAILRVYDAMKKRYHI